MPALNSFDYAIIRVVPRVEREEFLNAGVIIFCRSLRYLKAVIELDQARLQYFSPGIDLESIIAHLKTYPLVCAGDPLAGPVAQLSLAERFHWLVAPHSTIIQTSPAHSGFCSSPEKQLEHLLTTMVRLPYPE